MSTTKTKTATPTFFQRLGRQRAMLGPWPARDAVATKAFLGLLVVGLMAGPVALVATLMMGQGPSQPLQGSQPVPSTTASPAGPGDEFLIVNSATHLVELWLTATKDEEQKLRDAVISAPIRIELPTQRPGEPHLSTLTVSSAGTDLWTVVVRNQPDPSGPSSDFAVDVLMSENLPRPVSLPRQIPAPAGVGTPNTASLTPLATDHPAAVTAAGFAAAFLTGTGDLSRWVSPDATLTPITPAPCHQVTVTTETQTPPDSIPAQQATTQLLLTVKCDTTESSTTFQYGLELTGRDSRWEVSNTIPVSTVVITNTNR